MKEHIQKLLKNKKKILLIGVLIIILVGANVIKIPVKTINVKIFYTKPENGNVQLYWLDSENEIYSESNVLYEPIKQGKCELSLNYNHGDMRKFRIDFINEKKECIVKEIKFSIAGITYKKLKGKDLLKYIERVSNVEDLKNKSDYLKIVPATADPSVEFNKDFDSLVLNGFTNNYNIYNILSSIFIISVFIFLYFRKIIIQGIRNDYVILNLKCSDWFKIYICLMLCIMFIYLFVKKCIFDSTEINWAFVIGWLYCFYSIVVICVRFIKININSFLKKQMAIFFFSLFDILSVELLSNHILQILPQYMIFNIMIFYFGINILDLFIHKLKYGIMIVAGVSFTLELVDYYLMIFRGSHFVPWDIRAISTAASVMSNYKFIIEERVVISILCLTLEIILAFMLVDERRIVKKNQVVLSCVGTLMILFFVNMNHPYLFDVDSGYSQQGFTVGFFSSIKYMKYSTPKGYSKEKAEEILNKQKKINGGKIRARNVIIIMNESFSDLRVINDEIIDDSYMPYYDSLDQNVIKGNLYVPVFGGGTCNSEFEVLTGVSTRYTPTTPYVTTINRDIDSLCRYFDIEGYKSIAFHPFLIENWNRDKVYPYLGFQELYDMNDMDEKEYIRWCVSDKSDYKKVIELYNSNKNSSFFMHNVTMQNHGSYSEEYGNLENIADLSKYGEFPQAETYLSLIKQSDDAIKELCDYFSNVDDPTLICFFGDHQPSLEQEFYELLYGKKLDELTDDERMKQYITPFFIWTNYDIENQYIDKISANYLEDIILLTAGYDLTGYEAFTYQLFQQYPVISLNGIYDKKTNY